jgi:ligand-binding sensor domain-containing protein/two-component sensor histidine kinase
MKRAGSQICWKEHPSMWLALCSVLLGHLPLLGAGSGLIPYNVRVWQTDDGLPQNSVRAIAQTADGYLWVGTQEGLARFDGIRFTPVTEKLVPALRRGFITSLCVGSDGSLWVGCEQAGVFRFKEGRWSQLPSSGGLLSTQPRCLFQAGDGSLWIGSEGGLLRYRDGNFTTYAEGKEGLGDNSVRSLCEDNKGNLRIATKHGLSTLGPDGKLSTLEIGRDYIGNVLRCVSEDRHGDLWVGSNQGLIWLQENRRVSYGTTEGLPDRIVNTIHADRLGQLWIGTYGGLVRMVNGQVIPPPSRELVYGDLIHVVYEDQEGNLWAGGKDGLYRLTPAHCRTYTTRQGLTHDNVLSVCQDKAGSIWLATWGGGLNCLSGDRITGCVSTNGLKRKKLLALSESRDGSLWVSMDFDGGLTRLGAGCRSLLEMKDGLADAAIRVIHEDNQGTVWLGTSRGLKLLKGGKLTVLTAEQGLAGDMVMAIYEDGSGRVWVGTDNGLSCWQSGIFRNYTTNDGLSDNSINALHEDGEGTLWVGTKRGGLNRFKAGKFTSYTTRQGLFSDEIFEILEDDFGYFWLSCRNGIFRIQKKQLAELDEGKIKSLSCVPFGRADGLVSVQCNGVAKPAGWKGRDGRLWFPTVRGVVAIESSIRPNDQMPPVRIEEVIADRVRLNTFESGVDTERSAARRPGLREAPLEIPPGRGELEIHYTALSLQAPEKNHFKYLLEGVDSAWIDAGAQRTARYYNLGPGRYRFRVIACNNDGVWNEAGASLGLIWRPHYWQTWWSKLVLLAFAGLLLTAFYQARVARLREIERLRVQIAANLHDDVGARLTKVAMVTEMVERQTAGQPSINPHIRKISSATREIIQAMDEIVWTINPRNDTLDHLANYIFQYAEEYFQNTTVRCRLDVPPELPDVHISTEERHNLFMAVKEALNNVLKHSRATEVRLGLWLAEGKLLINIVDNGSGFLPEQTRVAGNGLANMRQRLEQIGGRLVLETRLGEGTTIRMEAKGE